MRRSTIRSVALLALLASLVLPSGAAEPPIKVVAAEFPPLTSNAGGQPGGVVLEVVREAGRRAGIALEFSFLPWQRAQLETQAHNNVLIIPFTRTPGRESSYQWVAPVLEFHTVLVTLAKPPSSIEEARTLVVGYVRGTSFKDEVEQEKFPYFEESNDDLTNAKKLKLGRIGAWITTDLMAHGVYRQAGFDPAELKYGPNLGPVKVSWVAASHDFPKEIAKKIASAIDQMRADGSYQAIVKRYR
ncbi:MAG TPA: transporter substrate-binding domain-containing protein [Burkholderiaceae bacterium]|nr:transporter substrate-binding domain-containing protein [Burkholderiaceae bacterium]